MSTLLWMTSVNEIPKASDDSLKMSLLTLDGRGRDVKRAALDELIKRATDKEYYAMLEANVPPL